MNKRILSGKIAKESKKMTGYMRIPAKATSLHDRNILTREEHREEAKRHARRKRNEEICMPILIRSQSVL